MARSAHNPFRVNSLSPNETGGTFASINPPPSFHSVAGEDEMTLNPMEELPMIQESQEEDEGGTTMTRSRSTTPVPEVRIDEAPLPPPPPGDDGLPSLPTSPSLSSPPPLARMNTGRSMDELAEDIPAPDYPDELPPSYTPNADRRHGEETLEVGPRRPFQPAVVHHPPDNDPRHLQPPPAQPHNHHHLQTPSQNSSSRTAAPQYGSLNRSPRRGRRGGLLAQWFEQLEQVAQTAGMGNMLSPEPSSPTTRQAAPGQSAGLRQTRSYSDVRATRTSSPVPPLPPRRLSPNPPLSRIPSTTTVSSSTSASSSSSTSRPPPPNIPSTATSDFARDFYAAGEADELLNLDRDAQAAGTPRSRARSFEGGPSNPLPNGSTRANGTEEDNKPTTRPVPGRVLLKDGKILVYPKGFSCPKCFNIGYKLSDISKPCNKCWNKYAKPYSPAMAYAPSGSASATTLQRPLPKLSPAGQAASSSSARPGPQVLRRQGCHRPTPSEPNLALARSPSMSMMIPGPMPGAYPPSPTTSTMPYSSPMAPLQHNMTGYGLVPSPTGTSSPPSAIVYHAGDPRLGGVLCWSCGGTGRRAYVIFDNSLCLQCSGVGRVYG